MGVIAIAFSLGLEPEMKPPTWPSGSTSMIMTI